MIALTLRSRPTRFAWMFLAAALVAAPAFARPQPKPTPPGPVPGNPLTSYLQRYSGLHPTGGIAVTGMAPGYAVSIYDDKRGKEYAYSNSFLHCDPTDTTGYVYLPKRSLIVLETPDHQAWVLGESYQRAFTGPDPIDQFIADGEADALRRSPPTTNLIELFKRWYDRNVKNERFYSEIYSDGQVKIYQAKLDQGSIGSLLLVPDWANVGPSAVSAKVKPGGVLKRVDYLSEYERVALDDLYPYVHKADRQEKRH